MEHEQPLTTTETDGATSNNIPIAPSAPIVDQQPTEKQSIFRGIPYTLIPKHQAQKTIFNRENFIAATDSFTESMDQFPFVRDRLIQSFSKQAPPTTPSVNQQKVARQNASTTSRTLFEHRRSINLQIALRKFQIKYSLQKLVLAFKEMDTSVFSHPDMIQMFCETAFTNEEFETVANYLTGINNPTSDLSIADQFCIKLIQNDLSFHYQLKWLLWSRSFELESRVVGVKKDISTVKSACTELLSSKSWIQLLSIVMGLRQYMVTDVSLANKSQSSRNRASGSLQHGFELKTLNSLKMIKGNQQKSSLLNELAYMIQLMHPRLVHDVMFELNTLLRTEKFDYYLFLQQCNELFRLSQIYETVLRDMEKDIGHHPKFYGWMLDSHNILSQFSSIVSDIKQEFDSMSSMIQECAVLYHMTALLNTKESSGGGHENYTIMNEFKLIISFLKDLLSICSNIRSTSSPLIFLPQLYNICPYIQNNHNRAPFSDIEIICRTEEPKPRRTISRMQYNMMKMKQDSNPLIAQLLEGITEDMLID